MKFRDIDKMANEEMQQKLMSAEIKKRKLKGCIMLPILLFLIAMIIVTGILVVKTFSEFTESLESLDQTSDQSQPEIVTNYYEQRSFIFKKNN